MAFRNSYPIYRWQLCAGSCDKPGNASSMKELRKCITKQTSQDEFRGKFSWLNDEGWRKYIDTNKETIGLLVHSAKSLDNEANSLDDELQSSIERFDNDVNSLKNEYKESIEHTDERIKSFDYNVILLEDDFMDIIEIIYKRLVPLESPEFKKHLT
ncbi:hypothetical protein JTB14_009175 [Gonioctena quinquepunctata]|nr:hypothetical protein JTB14_009175 [Gonioctena quinquepunctata]